MTPTIDELLVALVEMSRDFARLALQAPGELPVSATPGWNVTDVVGHVAMEPLRYLRLAEGSGEWPERVVDLPAFNAAQISGLPTRDPGELVALLSLHVEQLSAAARAFGDPPPMMNFDGNQRVRADLAIGSLLGEFAVHGHDIARASRLSWYIPPRIIPLVFAGLHQVLPGWVDPDRARNHTATYELRLRGGPTYIYEFTSGALVIDPERRRRVDAHIRFDPVTALLSSYGRIGRARPAMTGKVLVWGRRPWLAPRLRTRFLEA